MGGEQLPLRAGLHLLLEDEGGATDLAWPGGLQLSSIDPSGGPPHLNIGDQLGQHVSIRLGCPGPDAQLQR